MDFVKTINLFKEVVIIYGGWIVAHHVASHLYTEYCTPNTIIGFITAPLMVNTPQCAGLRWTVIQGSTTISTMWTMAGLLVIKNVKFQL
jgi:hypothetical protein